MIFDLIEVGSLPLLLLLEVETGERRSNTSSVSSSALRSLDALRDDENEREDIAASSFFMMGLGLK